jgi:hypothetical protein
MLRTKRPPASHPATRHFWGLARGVALIWLVPAVVFNVDWSEHGFWQANLAAVLMILGSALFIEAGQRLRSPVMTPLLVVAALFFVFVNAKAATRNLSLASEGASETKMAEIAGASHLASHRSQLEKRVESQVQLVGWTAVGVLESEFATTRDSEPGRWKSTSQCEDVTAPKSGTYCTRVNAAKARVETAKLRDKLQSELDAIPAPTTVTTATGEDKRVVDAYVSNTVALLTAAGFQPSERLVRAEEALSRALSFELLAALGPTAWSAFIDMLAGLGGLASTASACLNAKRPKPEARPTPRHAAAPEPTPNPADVIDRWIADDLEEAPTGWMKSKDLRSMCKAWCATHKVDYPREDEIWKRLRVRFKHDPNHNRPRYLNVRPRRKRPDLHVVGGTGA